MASLLELSHELLHCIFIEISPPDLASIRGTCRTLHAYINGNRLLHKDVYIRKYDEYKTDGDHNKSLQEVDWEEQLHQNVRLEKILESSDREVKREHLGFVAERMNVLLESALPDHEESLNIQLLADYFADTDNIDTILSASSLFAQGGTNMQRAAPTAQLRQASAKLHSLYGKPIDPLPSKRRSLLIGRSPFFSIRHIDPTSSPSENTRNQTRGVPTHCVARSKVYDLREYTEHSLWGPFMDDGSQNVDWEKVEAIMVVLGFNLAKFTERSNGRFPLMWDKPFEGATPQSYVSSAFSKDHDAGSNEEGEEEISSLRELSPSLDALDPYGVTGTWMRVVCFLDYNDLYAFNFAMPVPEEQARPPIDTAEGIIDLEEHLQVTRIEPAGSRDNEDDDYDPDGDNMDWSRFQGQRLPVVYFRGSSRSLQPSYDGNANSKIRGSVRQTPEGEIRWTTFSIFHGEERWRSEGIQVGGLRSARGILGNWFDKDYDMHGPAGPTAFWKITDELEDDKHYDV